MKRSIEAVVLSLMLLGAACHGKGASPHAVYRSSPSPRRYVSVVCPAVLEWKNDIEVAAASLVTDAASLQGATEYLDRVRDVTDRMLAQVQAVGIPTITDGPNPHSDVIHSLVAARSALMQVQAHVASLVAQGPLDLAKEVEVAIILGVEAVKSELRNPSSVEMVRATVSNTNCYTLFRRKVPLGTGA